MCGRLHGVGIGKQWGKNEGFPRGSVVKNLKEISPGCSLEGVMLKAETPVLWPPPAKS